jgi:hypothetical protein
MEEWLVHNVWLRPSERLQPVLLAWAQGIVAREKHVTDDLADDGIPVEQYSGQIRIHVHG